MSLQQKITEARKNKGFTQEEVAERANVTVRTIQRIESGETVPRNFTLKAIAKVLDIPFEELISKDNYSSLLSRESDREDAIHFLKMLNLSCFSYILLPYIHFLIPLYLLRMRKEQDMRIVAIGRKMIRTQIAWVIATMLVLLLTVVYNLGYARRYGHYYVHYLWSALVMYFLNAVIIIVTHFRLSNIVSSQDEMPASN